MVRAELLDDLDAVRPLVAAWDALAVRAGQPYCAPAWMLAWWRNVAPPDARLRVAVARDGDELVGIAPCWARRVPVGVESLRLLGAGTSSRVEPVAVPGREREAAEALAGALAGAVPPPASVVFDGVCVDSSWPERLAAGWPGGRAGRVHRQLVIPAPTLRLEGRTHEEWLAGRSGQFRSQLRRARRKLEAQGGAFRLSEGERLEADLDAFARLHHARWSGRGGSDALNAHVELMLLEAARELAPSGRLRLWMIDVDGRPISAQLFVAAGGEAAYWLGGFDEEFASLKPSLLALWDAVQDSFARGERRVDLGAGGQEYKYRFADGEDSLAWMTFVPPSGRAALARGRVVVLDARRSVGRMLGPERRARLKRLLARRPATSR